jgi:hypothetical protein
VSADLRESNVAYVLAKLRVRGVDYLLLHAHPKWGDWSLVGGHVEPTDRDWDAAAIRETQEEMAPLRLGEDLDVEALSVPMSEWGPVPSVSAGGAPTRYRVGATSGAQSLAAEWSAARDLLLRSAPRSGQPPGAPLVRDGEDAVAAVVRLCLGLDGTTLAIQGPPGSGKTYCAVQAILALVAAGKKVGVTANSHQVILGVLDKVCDAAPAEVVARVQHMGDAASPSIIRARAPTIRRPAASPPRIPGIRRLTGPSRISTGRIGFQAVSCGRYRSPEATCWRAAGS